MPTKEINIALADDHVLLRNALKELIHAFGGFKVIIEADNGSDLVEQIKRSVILPDICVLDVSMPVMDGYETQIELKKLWPDMKTLVLSQYNNEFTIIKLLKEGANGYLLKSAAPDVFKKALQSVAEHGYYHPELTVGKFEKYIESLRKEEKSENELTRNEKVFLALCCSELTYKDIAQKMDLSVRTVDGYRDNLFKKLHITSRSGLVMYALQTGIVPITVLPGDSEKGTG